MRLSTILNRVEKYKRFVYGNTTFEEGGDGPTRVIPVRPRKNGRAECSGCGRLCATYDRMKEPRRFAFVPLWGILVYFAYRMRRVHCRHCEAVRVPWCDGKNQLTTTYRWFLARWARRLAWSEVAVIFRTSWDSVGRWVEHAVEWGLSHRKREGVEAVGIDEISGGKGHASLTLVDQIGSGVKFACSDMGKPSLNVIREQWGQAVQVLDRFHIRPHFGKSLDGIRAEESKQLKRDRYEPVPAKSRWRLLKRPENLTDRQTVKLREVLKYNLRSVRAYLFREELQRFWTYTSGTEAGSFWTNGSPARCIRDWSR